MKITPYANYRPSIPSEIKYMLLRHNVNFVLQIFLCVPIKNGQNASSHSLKDENNMVSHHIRLHKESGGEIHIMRYDLSSEQPPWLSHPKT